MTDKEYNRLVELRNKCYQDRRDRETDITYFTGFNDGYEKGKENFEKIMQRLEATLDSYTNNTLSLLNRVSKLEEINESDTVY